MNYIFLTLGYHPELDGGAWRYAAEVSEGLAAKGHSVDVVCPLDDLSEPKTEQRQGVTLHWFPRAQGNFFKKLQTDNLSASRIVKAIQDLRPASLLVTHHAYLGNAFIECSGPKVFMFHGPWAQEYRMAKRVDKRRGVMRWFHDRVANWLHVREHRAVLAAKEVFVVSEHFKHRITGWHGDDALPSVSAISGGVDFEQFQALADRRPVRARYGLAQDDFLFLTLRRLDSRMGLRLLIDAFARVVREFPNAKLWMAGKGPLREELEESIKSKGLEQNAKLLGFVPEEELPDVLNAADCTVMPSLDLEGFGLATVESLACGTPVLGSDAGATPELIEPLSKALLFSANDVDALHGILRRTLSGELVLPERVACTTFCQNNFGWQRPVQAFESVSERIVI